MFACRINWRGFNYRLNEVFFRGDSIIFYPQLQKCQLQMKRRQNQIKISQNQIELGQYQIIMSQIEVKIDQNHNCLSIFSNFLNICSSIFARKFKHPHLFSLY